MTFFDSDPHTPVLKTTWSLAGYAWENDGSNNRFTSGGVALDPLKADLDSATGFEASGGLRGRGITLDWQLNLIRGETVAEGFTGGIYVDGVTHAEQRRHRRRVPDPGHTARARRRAGADREGRLLRRVGQGDPGRQRLRMVVVRQGADLPHLGLEPFRRVRRRLPGDPRPGRVPLVSGQGPAPSTSASTSTSSSASWGPSAPAKRCCQLEAEHGRVTS